MIGRKLTEREGGGSSSASGGAGSQGSVSWHEEMDYQVQPREFSELKTGGYEHDSAGGSVCL